MKSKTDCMLLILLSFSLLFGQLGCSTTHNGDIQSKSSTKPEIKASRLKVAIVLSEELPSINCITYDTGRGRAAAKTAGEGAAGGAIVGALIPLKGIIIDNEPGAVILLPLTPFLVVGGAILGATGGAIVGAIRGDYKESPMANAEQIRSVVEYAYAMSDIKGIFAEHLMQAGHDFTDYQFTVAKEEEIEKTVDIILKAGFTHLEFRGENEKDPDTRLKVRVDVIVEDVKSMNRFTDSFEYISGEYDLSDWLDNNGKLLRQEYENCYRVLSTNIITEMFINNEHYIADLLTPKAPSNPVVTEKKEMPPDTSYLLAYAPKAQNTDRLLLRSKSGTNLSAMRIRTMVSQYGFFDSSLNPYGSFDNDFLDNDDGTITDHATGLMWQKSGSSKSLKYAVAKKYINNLNVAHFAGYYDWRMPTVDELASLLKKDKDNNLHISSIFDSQQHRCWSSDEADNWHKIPNAITLWVMDYNYGKARRAYFWDGFQPREAPHYTNLPDNYVRAVRTIKK